MKACVAAGLLLLLLLPVGAHAQSIPVGCDVVEPLAVYFSGEVESAGPAHWQVSGQALGVDAMTEIEPAGSGVEPGAWASVAARWHLDGSLLATRIELSPTPPSPPVAPTSFTGLIEALGPEEWTVGGVRVALTPATVVVGQPAVGSVALVQALPTTPRQALLLAAAPPGIDPVFFEGVLTAMADGLWQVQTGVATVEVAVAGAYVQGIPAPGLWVEVMALERAGQPLDALVAFVTPAEGRRVAFGGRLLALISATQPEQWLLLTASEQGPWLEVRTLAVDRLTVPIDETAGPVVPGAWIEASASPPLLPQQPWGAHHLRVDLGVQATVRGSIAYSEPGAPARWQVDERCVIVDEQTALDGRPRTGRYAIVQGVDLGAGTVWARSAAVRYRFAGVLTARLTHLSPEVWVILVAPPPGVDVLQPTRVYLAIDATSDIDPALLHGVLDRPVAVQARAGPSGWLADWVDDPATPWQPRLLADR